MGRLLVLTLVAAAAASAQTMVEYSLGSASSAAGAAGMKGVGNSAAAALDKAAKALGKTAPAETRSSTSIVLPGAAPAVGKPVKFTAPDPAQIHLGMDRDELIRKFGEPAMKISGTENSAETWWYGSGAEEVTLKLLDGKVTSVTPPVSQAAAKAAPSSAKPDPVVVVLP
jgi:hypothetical protein